MTPKTELEAARDEFQEAMNASPHFGLASLLKIYEHRETIRNLLDAEIKRESKVMCRVCEVMGVPDDVGDEAYRFVKCDYCNPQQPPVDPQPDLEAIVNNYAEWRKSNGFSELNISDRMFLKHFTDHLSTHGWLKGKAE